eukprot:tig00020510_g9874.t1
MESSGSSGGGGLFGRASTALSGKGLGWMLEVDDEDDLEMYQRPLMEELDIDLKDIFLKAKCILVPTAANRAVLAEATDFWGPLFVVLAYGMLLLWRHLSVVSWVITIWVVGSILISVVSRLLGCEASFSRTLGVTGYSCAPLVVAAIALVFFGRVPLFSFLIKAGGVCWATFASGSIIMAGAEGLEKKRGMIFYPTFLLYMFFVNLMSGV